jgi:hypothetical protein
MQFRSNKKLKTLITFLVLGALVGFIAVGGWEVIFNFEEWRYGTFYRANNDELTFLAQWFFFGPARGMAAGLAIATLCYFLLRKKQDTE